MSTKFLPSHADIARAASDTDHYADTLARLGGHHTIEGARFAADVLAVYNAAKNTPLTYAEKAVLKFAARDPRESPTAGHREAAIRDEFGYCASRFYQVLNALIDRPEALAHDPLLVGRLRRQRDTRRQARTRQPVAA